MTRHILTLFFYAGLLRIFALPVYSQPMVAAPGAFYPQLSAENAAQLAKNSPLLTLQFEKAPLQTVLDAIEAQSGIKLNIFGNDEATKKAPITLNIEKQALWPTLYTLAGMVKSDFWVTQSEPQEEFLEKTTNSHFLHGLATQHGPFLILVNGIERSSRIELNFDAPLQGAPTAQPQTQRHSLINTSVSFSVFTDLGLQNTVGTSNFEITEARDNKGNLWLPTVPTPYETEYNFEQRCWVPIQSPSNPGDSLAVVKGTFHALMAKQTELWEIPDALNLEHAEKVVETNGQVKSYIFEGLVKVSDVYQLKLKIRTEPVTQTNAPPNAPPLSAARLARIGNLRPTPQLFDSKGFHLRSRGTSSNSSQDETNMTVTFSEYNEGRNLPTLPLKVVIDIPTELSEVSVPFEFTNLPLP